MRRRCLPLCFDNVGRPSRQTTAQLSTVEETICGNGDFIDCSRKLLAKYAGSNHREPEPTERLVIIQGFISHNGAFGQANFLQSPHIVEGSRPTLYYLMPPCRMPALLHADYRLLSRDGSRITAQCKSAVSGGCNVVTCNAIRVYPTDIRHKYARFARDIRTHVPGRGGRIQGCGSNRFT